MYVGVESQVASFACSLQRSRAWVTHGLQGDVSLGSKLAEHVLPSMFSPQANTSTVALFRLCYVLRQTLGLSHSIGCSQLTSKQTATFKMHRLDSMSTAHITFLHLTLH